MGRCCAVLMDAVASVHQLLRSCLKYWTAQLLGCLKFCMHGQLCDIIRMHSPPRYTKVSSTPSDRHSCVSRALTLMDS